MKHTIGSIHGRFQPFHNGHARYLNAALERCDHLIIGITQYDIKNLGITPEAMHRSESSNNPLTYQERCDIISAYLKGSGIPETRFKFCPFPIEDPEKIKDFIPTETVCFTTMHSEWNAAKIKKLEKVGFSVEVLLEPDESRTKDLSATQIRQFIRDHNESWKTLMPKYCVDKLITAGSYEKIASNV